MSNIFSIYFAGDLFNHKDLIGNLLLSEAINKNSSGRYVCVVPQHLEQSTSRSVEIRNNDLLQIIKADLILLNFDGTELDSGTVIEFLFAKACASLNTPLTMLPTLSITPRLGALIFSFLIDSSSRAKIDRGSKSANPLIFMSELCYSQS